jgi:hypothetical protein
MDPITIANLGGPYTDAVPADNPETDLDADNGNLALEIVAQASQTVERARCLFVTTAVAAPTVVAAANVTNRSNWGSGSAQKPVVTKTATGRYTLTYAATYVNGLTVTETVAFTLPWCQAWGANPVDNLHARVLSVASNVINVVTQSPLGTDADVGNSSGNPFNVSLGLL